MKERSFSHFSWSLLIHVSVFVKARSNLYSGSKKIAFVQIIRKISGSVKHLFPDVASVSASMWRFCATSFTSFIVPFAPMRIPSHFSRVK